MESYRPLEIGYVDLPELDHAQVQVRVLYSGICGAQVNEIEAVKGPDKFLPHLLGHEGSGVVEAIGPGVTRVQPGDHVVLHWRRSAGPESATPCYTWDGGKVNAGWVTTFNDRALVSQDRVTPIPRTFCTKLAALFGCAVTTAIGVVNNDANVKIGESVVVLGVGGVGINIVQAACLAGAHPIVAVDLIDLKLSLSEKFGATHSVNAGQPKWASSVRDIVGSQGADGVIDTTGRSDIIQTGYKLAGSGGRIILVGYLLKVTILVLIHCPFISVRS